MKTKNISIQFKWQETFFECIAEIITDNKMNDYYLFVNEVAQTTKIKILIEELNIIFPGIEYINITDQKSTYKYTHNIDHIIKNNDIDNIMICCSTKSDLDVLIQQTYRRNSIRLQKIGFNNSIKKALYIKDKLYLINLEPYFININTLLHYIKIHVLINNQTEEVVIPKHFLRYLIIQGTEITEFICTDYIIDVGVELFITILNSYGLKIQLLQWSYVREVLQEHYKVNIFNKEINTCFLLPKASGNFINSLKEFLSKDIKNHKSKLLKRNFIIPFNINVDLCTLKMNEVQNLAVNQIIISTHPGTLKHYYIDGISCLIDVINDSPNQLKVCGVRYAENR